jgi:aspartyl-tRNA(Asn)/glutamyl-tRNA(Gln) amidotransferase subunit A
MECALMSSIPTTIFESAAAMRRGELTPSALLDACLNRIDRLEDQLHAWVCVDEENARREARRLDEELAHGKPPRTPLHGIPVGIKDVFDVIGLPTQAGSPLLRGQIAAADAPVVACLRRAGAVIVGKTVTTEFACFDPSPTRNPWNPAHTPGGSSSGSAAAVATGMCLAALGSQTGGSITRPASYCGVCGLKPTFGRLSLLGVVPIAFHLDHAGAFTRTVSDLELVWTVLSQDQPDALAAPTPPPRLGVLGGFFTERADDAVRSATHAALARLEAAGARLSPCPLPEEFLEVHSNHRRIMAVEAAEYHRWRYLAHRDQYGPNISALIEEGLSVTAVDYAAALKFQAGFRREVLDSLSPFDALIAPATVTPAPASLDTTGDPAFNSPWSLGGTPTLSLPCGLSPQGMPCSLQFIGRWQGEAELLRVAAWCEARLRFEPWQMRAFADADHSPNA